MKVILTTFPKYQYLVENCSKLHKKFWDREFDVDCAKDGEKLTEQLLRITKELEDEYLILVKDDFYLIEKVDDRRVRFFEAYARTQKADRLSLQCVKDGYEKCSGIYDKVLGEVIYRLTPQSEYLCSLEASIWKRDSLRTLLESGLVQYGSDRDAECNLVKNVRSYAFKVLVPKVPVLVYKDAKIGGQDRIRFVDGSMEVLSQGSDGSDEWVKKNIQI